MGQQVNRLPLFACLAAALVSCGGSGCSGSGDSGPGAGGAGGMVVTTSSTVVTTGTTTTSSSTTTTTTTTGPGGGPCPGWPGWRAWDDVAPEMPYCVPETAAALPEPVGWKDCPPQSGFTAGCRELDPTWLSDGQPFFGPIEGYADASGVVLMLDRRARGEPLPYRMRTVQDADGPVRWAFLQDGPLSTAWELYNSTNHTGTRQGRTVFKIRQTPDEHEQAIVGGSIDDLAPSVLDYRHISVVGHYETAGGGLWATYQAGVFFTAPWDGSAAVDVSTAFSGQQGFAFIHDDFAVWKAGNWPTTGKLVAYTPALGAYPFVDYGSGYHYVDGFATDGTDMVWLHDHDKQATQDPWGQRDIMTAPFTTDPVQVVQRRLRSYPGQSALNSQFAVGCGHAAVAVHSGLVFVIRIADGYWWQLPGDDCVPIPGSWCYNVPVALTCDELFVQSWVNNGSVYIRSVSRIQLSSLGAPSPPD